ASSVVTPDAEPNVVPDVTTSLAPDNLVDYSESDESPKPKFANEEMFADKDVNEDPDVVIMNETTASDKSHPTNFEASVARRTRSRAGKGVETAITPVQTPKPTRSAKGTGKKPLYGPPKPVSKVIPRNEEKQKVKKRKAPPTSDSEFEPETDVAASSSTSRKSIGRNKVPQSVPYAPLDNVSFHLENESARWKFVYPRRLALERNLKEDILQCQNIVDAIEYAGLIKTVCGLDKCYDRLVKEFLINVAENCDDPTSPEYRQVFVRGKCVKFSPTVINQYLQRNTEEVADLKVTDNEVCKVITGGKIKVCPSKAKLAATSLSPFYAILNRVAAHNWVPTTHSGDVVRGLGKFIYAVSTKAKFDYGTYFFHETLSHAVTYAVEKPIAFPTLLCNVILEQHPNILRSTDVPCKRKGKLTIEQRLLTGTNVAAGVGPSVQAGVLSRKQMIADLTETSRALKARKLKIDRVIEALKAEEAAETAEGEPDGQEGAETSGSDDGTEDMVEDSDESSSI
ncbi:envelope-like protein, partial [Trifolium pratense]